MNASRARRRWLTWCRYVGKTQSVSRAVGAGVHAGQAKAYRDAMYARRYFLKGARPPFRPTWGSVR